MGGQGEPTSQRNTVPLRPSAPSAWRVKVWSSSATTSPHLSEDGLTSGLGCREESEEKGGPQNPKSLVWLQRQPLSSYTIRFWDQVEEKKREWGTNKEGEREAEKAFGGQKAKGYN